MQQGRKIWGQGRIQKHWRHSKEEEIGNRNEWRVNVVVGVLEKIGCVSEQESQFVHSENFF